MATKRIAKKKQRRRKSTTNRRRTKRKSPISRKRKTSSRSKSNSKSNSSRTTAPPSTPQANVTSPTKQSIKLVEEDGELEALAPRLLRHGIIDEEVDKYLDFGSDDYRYAEFHQVWKPQMPVARLKRMQIIEVIGGPLISPSQEQSAIPLDVKPRLFGDCKFEWFDAKDTSLRLRLVDDVVHGSLYESYASIDLPSFGRMRNRILKVSKELLRKVASMDKSVSYLYPPALNVDSSSPKASQLEQVEAIALFLALDRFAATTTNIRLPVDNRQSGRYLVPLTFDLTRSTGTSSTSGKREFQLAILVDRYMPPQGPYDLAGPEFNQLRSGETVPLWQKPKLVVIDKIDLPGLTTTRSSLPAPNDAYPHQVITPSLTAFEYSTQHFDWSVSNMVGRGAVSGGVVKVKAAGELAAVSGREDSLVVVKLMSTLAYPRTLADLKRELYYGIWLSTFVDSGQYGANALIRTIGWVIIGNYVGIILEYIHATGLDQVYDYRMASVDVLKRHYADANAARKSVEAMERAKQDGKTIDEAELRSARRDENYELRQAEDVKSVLSKRHISIYAPLSYLLDVLSAVSFMHSKGIVHKDIKDSNIIVNFTNSRATLLDVGSCGLIGVYSATTVTRGMAPDSIFGEETYLFKNGYVDVYACARLIRAWTRVPAVAAIESKDPVIGQLRALAERYLEAGEDDPRATIDNLLQDYWAIISTVPIEKLDWQPPVTNLPDLLTVGAAVPTGIGILSSVGGAVSALFNPLLGLVGAK